MQIWMGLFASGTQQSKGRLPPYVSAPSIFRPHRFDLFICSGLNTLTATAGQVSDQAFSSKLAKISPTPYQLKIVREDAKNKCVSSSVSCKRGFVWSPCCSVVQTAIDSCYWLLHTRLLPKCVETSSLLCFVLQDGGVNYSLHKASLPYRNNQYEWELTDRQGDRTDSIVLKHGSADHVAKIERLDGTAVVTLQQGGFYTLNRFKWGSKTYRYSIHVSSTCVKLYCPSSTRLTGQLDHAVYSCSNLLIAVLWRMSCLLKC